MRIAATALVALAVSPAAADTAVSLGGATCEVRFVRAPDDIRHEIEKWLAAEPRCTSSIDLRVVPTDDGIYLLAQRPDGRIHERLVPDAQSAGVLVASWVADDWVEPPPAPAPAPAPVAPRPLIVNPFADDLGVGARAPARPSVRDRSLSLTALVQATGEGGGGLRGELDIWSRGRWSLAVALSISSATYDANERTSYATEDYKAVAHVARTSTFGAWQLRLSAGAGVIATQAHVTDFPDPGTVPSEGSYNGREMVSPIGEVAASVSRRFSRNWAVTAGTVLGVMSQRLVDFDPYSWDSQMPYASRELDMVITGGLRYAL